MDIYKNKDIDVSVNVDSIDKGNIKANFYTEDKGTSSIRIYLNWNKNRINLNSINMQPQLDLFHSDGSIFMDEKVDIILAEQGLIQYKITDQVIKHPGTVNAKLFLKNEKESIHVANFSFNIKDSGITDAVDKEITVNLVDDSVRRIIQENAIELLGEGFKDEVSVELQNYVSTNTELFKGPKGDLGPQGLRGPQGVKGDTGDRGLQGPQGVQGERGIQGEQGPEGPQGVKGDTGDRGLQGPQGVQGERGIQGEQGPEGPRGMTGDKGDKGEDATQSFYISIDDIGAIGDETSDNTELFKTFDNAKTYYIPQGLYKTNYIPQGLFFGEGSIMFNDEIIPISQNVPQKVRVDMDKSSRERYQSFIAGQNAGKLLNESTYGITGVGYSVFKNNETGRRLTAYGKGAMSNLKGGYSSVALGADALGQGIYTNRNVAVGDNALKWGGATNAISTLHDYWLTTGQENFINANFVSKYPEVWSLLGSETQPDENLYPTNEEEYTENTAVGRNALLHQMKGSQNTAIGYNSQAHTMIGNQNTSVGNRSLRDNLGGSRNSSFGNEALASSITGQDNTAVGADTLQNILHAVNNTAIGFGAMKNFSDSANLNTDETKTKGQRNTAVGTQAMYDGKNASNSTFIGSYAGQVVEGDWNVGIGSGSMQSLTTGKSNVGVGSYSNRAVIKGSNNVSVGYSAGPGGDYSNTVSIGHNVHAKGSNQIQIGDETHTVYTSSAIQTNSDKSLKDNIRETLLGLDFIKSLNPVDYKYKGSDVQRHGFIAQDVPNDFGGVSVNSDGIHSIAYSELIAPMVKAMQEQQAIIDKLQKDIKELKKH